MELFGPIDLDLRHDLNKYHIVDMNEQKLSFFSFTNYIIIVIKYKLKKLCEIWIFDITSHIKINQM